LLGLLLLMFWPCCVAGVLVRQWVESHRREHTSGCPAETTGAVEEQGQGHDVRVQRRRQADRQTHISYRG
jgi:hypothetical protein